MTADSQGRIGFVGLGRMGSGMARNLLKGGADLVVHDRLPQAMAALAAGGVRTAGTLGDLVAQVDVLFTSLPGPAEVEQAALGEDGILARMRPGLVWLDLTTNAHATVLQLGQAMADRGGEMLDAPVSGGPAGAASGELVLWVGGSAATFDRMLPVLRLFSSWQQRMGGIGAGTVTKLAHNMLGYTLMQAMAEAFSLAVKGGIDPMQFWTALGAGLVGRKPVTHMLVNQFLPGTFDQPAFAQRLALKDITLATRMAADMGVPVALSDLTCAEMRRAVEERGWADWDSRAFLQLQLERAGVRIAVPRDEIAAALKSG